MWIILLTFSNHTMWTSRVKIDHDGGRVVLIQSEDGEHFISCFDVVVGIVIIVILPKNDPPPFPPSKSLLLKESHLGNNSKVHTTIALWP